MVIFLQFLADFDPHLESNFVHMKDLYVHLGYILQGGGTSLHAYNFQEKQVNIVININYHIFRTWNSLQSQYPNAIIMYLLFVVLYLIMWRLIL